MGSHNQIPTSPSGKVAHDSRFYVNSWLHRVAARIASTYIARKILKVNAHLTSGLGNPCFATEIPNPKFETLVSSTNQGSPPRPRIRRGVLFCLCPQPAYANMQAGAPRGAYYDYFSTTHRSLEFTFFYLARFASLRK